MLKVASTGYSCYFLCSCSLLATLLLVAAIAPPARAADPASSWLAYAVTENNGETVTFFEAFVTVPERPRSDNEYMAFWIGVEPDPAVDLFQPILALSDGQYQIWNEEFLWQSSYDYQSSPLHVVQPGDVVQMQLELFKEESLYRLMCRRVSSSSKGSNGVGLPPRPSNQYPYTNFSIPYHKDFTQAFVVLEHQNECAGYPANGNIVFSNITVEFNNVPVTPSWRTTTHNPVCHAQVQALNSTTIEFTFNTGSTV